MYRKTLTRKQQVFLRAYLEGMNATQAALVAYHTSPNSAKVIGSKLLTNVNIQRKIADVLDSNSVSLSMLVKNITNLAFSEPKSISGVVKLKSNIELLKLHGVYSSGTNSLRISAQRSVNSMTSEEAKKELLRLQEKTVEFASEVEA